MTISTLEFFANMVLNSNLESHIFVGEVFGPYGEACVLTAWRPRPFNSELQVVLDFVVDGRMKFFEATW